MLYVYVATVRASLCLQAPDASASTGSSCFSLYRLRLLQPLQAQVVSASTGSGCFSLCRLKLHQPLQAQVASGFCTRGVLCRIKLCWSVRAQMGFCTAACHHGIVTCCGVGSYIYNEKVNVLKREQTTTQEHKGQPTTT